MEFLNLLSNRFALNSHAYSICGVKILLVKVKVSFVLEHFVLVCCSLKACDSLRVVGGWSHHTYYLLLLFWGVLFNWRSYSWISNCLEHLLISSREVTVSRRSYFELCIKLFILVWHCLLLQELLGYIDHLQDPFILKWELCLIIRFADQWQIGLTDFVYGAIGTTHQGFFKLGSILIVSIISEVSKVLLLLLPKFQSDLLTIAWSSLIEWVPTKVRERSVFTCKIRTIRCSSFLIKNQGCIFMCMWNAGSIALALFRFRLDFMRLELLELIWLEAI